MTVVYCDATPKGLAAVYKDGRVNFFSITAATHNEAEYQAILYALKSIDLHKHVEIVSDSQVVVRQLTGEYRCQGLNLRMLWREVQDVIVKRGLVVTYRWVPREQNLAGIALDRHLFL